MADTWGNALKLSIFGESHGRAIGIVIDGLPAGLRLDEAQIKEQMFRRAPGKHRTATARKESDAVEIVSGFFEGKTTGGALCGIIKNSDTRSGDYSEIKRAFRPGHADFPAFIRYGGFEDYRGGGHFSGRLTAPLLFAGAVAQQYLSAFGIEVYGRIKNLAGIADEDFDLHELENMQKWKNARLKVIPALNDELGQKMEEAIIAASKDLDSVGGTVEIVITGAEAGLGNPFFDSVESEIAHLAFSVPAVKGIEFGTGFGMAELKGSQTNDEYYEKDGQVFTYTNHNGGITGGITNSMPIIYRCVVKPTPSISRKQRTVTKDGFKDISLIVKGRHDPAIVPRVVPVLEAVGAIALADLLLGKEGR